VLGVGANDLSAERGASGDHDALYRYLHACAEVVP
jgi:hypothetical protein